MKQPARRSIAVPDEVADVLERRGVSALSGDLERVALLDEIRPRRRQSMDVLRLFIALADVDEALERLDRIEEEIERKIDEALQKQLEDMAEEEEHADEAGDMIKDLDAKVASLEAQVSAQAAEIVRLKAASKPSKGFF